MMHQTRSLAEPTFGVASIEHGCFQRGARCETVPEVERIVATGDTKPVCGVLLNSDAPGAAPGKRTKPYGAGFFVAGIARDGEPRIVLMARRAPPTFQHRRPWGQLPLIEAPLACPAARERIQPIVAGPRQAPGRSGCLLHDQRLAGVILDACRTRQDSGF